MRLRAPAAEVPSIRSALLDLFGADQPLSIDLAGDLGDDVVQYTSEIEGSLEPVRP